MNQECKEILIEAKMAFYQVLLDTKETIAIAYDGKLITVFENSDGELEYTLFNDVDGESFMSFDGGVYDGNLINLLEETF